MPNEITLAPVQHRYVPSPNGPLHALDFGGDSTPLVCLHGVTGSAWAWHDVASALPGQRLVALDMRGHGDSAWSPTHAYDTSEHVADLALQVDALGVDTVDLAGSSWGALVALEYAAANPDRVGRLALVDIEPSFDASSTDVPPRPRQFRTWADAAVWSQESNPRAPQTAIEAVTYGTFQRVDAETVRPKHDPFLFEKWPFRDGDHWDAIANVSCDTLLVNAGYTFVRPEIMEKMHDMIAGSELVKIAESGHVVPVDNPVALAAALSAFLGR